MKQMPFSEALLIKDRQEIKAKLSGKPSTQVIEGELMVYLKTDLDALLKEVAKHAWMDAAHKMINNAEVGFEDYWKQLNNENKALL